MPPKYQIAKIVLPAIEQQMKKLQPVIEEQINKMTPIVIEQLKKIQPALKEQAKKLKPVIERQVRNVIIPWVHQRIASSLPPTHVEDMFPVNWDVDKFSENEKYKLKLNVKSYKPENVKVKVVNDKVVIEGEHKERTARTEQGVSETYVSRHFITEFKLPDGINPKDVQSSVRDGFVNILATKNLLQGSKRKEEDI